MAGEYIVKLSSVKETVEVIKGQNPDGTPIKEDLSMRKAETDALKAMINSVAAGEKDRKKYNNCIDLLAQLENLSDKDDLIIDNSDVDALEKGFEGTAGQRPYFWTKLRTLFRQFDNLKANEVEIKPDKKPKKE